MCSQWWWGSIGFQALCSIGHLLTSISGLHTFHGKSCVFSLCPSFLSFSPSSHFHSSLHKLIHLIAGEGLGRNMKVVFFFECQQFPFCVLSVFNSSRMAPPCLGFHASPPLSIIFSPYMRNIIWIQLFRPCGCDANKHKYSCRAAY